TCKAGQCVANCAQGQILCAGRCVNPASDPANCGGCGMACALNQMCQAGVCAGGNNGKMTGCNGAVNCLNACVDPMCDQACYKNASPQGQQLLTTLLNCLEAACPSMGGGVCDASAKLFSAKNCDACYQLAQDVGGACRKSLNACLAS